MSPGGLLGFISTQDHRAMRRVQRWHAPRWIRLWMVCATRGGDGWLWYTMAIVILAFGGQQRLAAAGAAATAVGVGIAVFLVLKRTAGRKRPCAIHPHCWATLAPPDQFSFPSGHSITAFAVAVSLGQFYPSLMCGLIFCASSIAVSRIVLGMHFLSDVIVGCSIGVLLGCAAFMLFH